MKTIRPLFQGLVVVIAVGLMPQIEPGFAAAWEGTDDFSGTLAKWDTTYIHIDNPNDGFFLSGGQLQFIKTATTTDSGSGAVIWPQSLPFNTNWTLMVDAHMNPGTSEAPQIADQDVRLDVHLFNTNPAPGMPSFRIGVNTSPYAGTYGNFITIEGSDPTNIVGTDITLGMTYDSAAKQVTSFYFPVGNSNELVTIQTNDVSAWPEMRAVLYGASDYWAVSASKVWMDNFRVYGTANSRPSIAISKVTVPAALVPTNGLVAYYPFNGNANDASGYHNNPVLNTASLTADRLNTPESAYGFFGAQQIQFASQPQLETTTNLTVSCWVRTTNTDSAFHGLVCKATASNPWVGFQLASFQSRVRFEVDLTGFGGTTPINDGQWHFVCAVVDRQQQLLRLFVDDKLDATYSTPGSNIVTQFPLFIGAGRGGVGFFDGSIDEVRLYNRALSASEVQQLRQNGPPNGLVAYYPFNGNADDATGNGHNGSAQNTFSTTNQFGQPNSALGFLGNSWVSVPYAPALATTNFTVSLMFNAQASFDSFCLLRSGGLSSDFYRGYQLNSVDSHTMFGIWTFDGTPSYGNGRSLTPIANWQQNTWYNLAFTQSGLNAGLYLNVNVRRGAWSRT